MNNTRKLVAVVVAATICAGVAPHAIGDVRATANKPAVAAGAIDVLTGWRSTLLRMLGWDASDETTRVIEAVQTASPPPPTPGEPPAAPGDEGETILQTDPADSGGDVGPDWDPNG